jgi:formate C-acetyltransferase
MPPITLSDLSLERHVLSPRVEALRKAYFRAMPEVCIERASLVTEVSRELGLFSKSRLSSLDKARLYRRLCERRALVVWHRTAMESGSRPFELSARSLFAGSTTTRFKGVPLYPELMALALWPELQTLSTRAHNPYAITDEQVRALNEDVFPFWLECNISELGRKRSVMDQATEPEEAKAIKLLDHLVFFLTSKPNCISHTIPDFSQAISVGVRGIAERAKAKGAASTDDESRDFYAAIVEAMAGIVAYSQQLAAEARRLAAVAREGQERDELLALAEIHERVPEQPARSFREGLTTVWMCWVAAHLENSNVGLSLGRLDQVLYPLYAKDVASGTLSVDEAIELLCCLWLKIGDHVPTVSSAGEQLFGGTGSNQAITVGGVDKDGNDAVNDCFGCSQRGSGRNRGCSRKCAVRRGR